MTKGRRAEHVGAGAAVGLLWSASRPLTLALAVTVAGGAVTATGLVVTTGLVVGALPAAVDAGLGSGAGRHLLLTLVAFGAVAVAQTVLAALERGLTAALRLRAARRADERVMAAALAPSGIGHLEDPGYADTLRLATDPETRPDALADLLPDVVRPRLQAVGLACLLASFAWWAPVLLGLSAVLTYRAYLGMAHSVHGTMAEAGGVIRRAGYYRSLAIDPEPAKEVRLFGLGTWLADRMSGTWHAGMRGVWAARRRATGRAYGTVSVVLLAEAAVLGWAALTAARGALDLSHLVVVVQAAIALPALAWVGDADYLTRSALLGLRSLTGLERRSRTALAGETGPVVESGTDAGPRAENGAETRLLEKNDADADGAAQAPPIRREIFVDSLTFTYPGTGRKVVDGLSLRIPAGSSVALVGANGAGKTTLVKLLARLYEPDGGRITADGTDVRAYEPTSWRRQLAPLLQDFIKYPLSLRENIAPDAPSTAHDHDDRDDQHARTARERALSLAGAEALPGLLGRGWETVLSRQYEGGTDLSGGQWQKVALARALHAARDGAVLVLDEPTAHLDARAEAEFFERFLGVTRGSTTLLVSHRFSGVRRADLIYVLDRGRVVEAGSHARLMAQGGRYARMYRLQAARFQDDEDDAADHLAGVDAFGEGTPRTAGARGAPERDEDDADDEAGGASSEGDVSEEDEPRARRVGGVLAALGTVLAGSFRESKGLAVLGLLLVPAAAGLGALQALWLRSMTDGAAHQALGTTLTAALLLVATLGVGQAVQLAGVTARIGLSERVGFAFDRRLARLSAGIHGLTHHESPAFQDRLHLLRARILAMGGLLNWLLNLLEDLGGFLVTAVLLSLVHPALLALPLVGVVALRLQVAARKVTARAQEESAADHRLAGHLARLAASPAAGMELRLFGAGPALRRRHRAARDRADTVLTRAEWRVAAIGGAAGMLNTASLLGAVGVAAVLAARGSVSLGSVLLAVLLAGRFVGHVAGLVATTGVVADLLRGAERFRWLRAYARRARPAAATARVPDALRHGISLDGLSFRYPGTSSPVLRDVTLRLPAGGVVALVGENGSGKTTLVKLLCRMYEPTRGRVLADGVGLAAFDPALWRARLSAGFQDFVRFELPAGETVGVGDVPRLDDRAAVRSALARAGAADLPAGLPGGLATQLGRQWPDGVDLSGGQWQKLALARALMRTRPLLLVLDEPTASLDAETEHALFERLTAAAHRANGAASGAITLLVSHRFSTVRAADLIVVLDRGRVAELGSHRELMARGGLYASMYGVQARAYR
ncbi:ABC transporter ATP-binding protein [Streptomyces sp. NPDC003077]|uniref:ABC transporter ATP-binding protein n=1 Tax=Streptomyces sp. NPDC003077 TaxID=3154443 RepID=UPI0033A8059A